MSKTLRVPEKWFRRGLWLVAVVFASFLIGLGGLLVGDLPHVERHQQLDDFIPANDAATAKAAQVQADLVYQQMEQTLGVSQQAYDAEHARYQSARDTFDNWVATRRATQRPDQDTELIARTQSLDVLKQMEDKALQHLMRQRALHQQAKVTLDASVEQWNQLRDAARPLWQAQMRALEMRVFLYRLALTLPLLLLAGWLFVKQRTSSWWPFVWGFIFFALFTFFIELVPYLPSYGGYVRYIVGIALTVVIGRWAIVALQRYLERQQQAEQQAACLPAAQRRVSMAYDTALTHLAKGLCPSCERPVDLKDGVTDFCPHCGVGLYVPCHCCKTRKSAFTKFCFQCGTGTQIS